MIGSMYVNDDDGADAQLIVNAAQCGDHQLNLMITNHDDGQSASLIVDKAELLRIVQEATA